MEYILYAIWIITKEKWGSTQKFGIGKFIKNEGSVYTESFKAF